MTARRTFRLRFAAQDPAHARLVAAVAVTAGMLISTLFGQFIVHAFHAQTGLLAMAMFLSVQAGSMVKDTTALARVVTTALLIPALMATIALAALLSTYRPVVIGGFIVLAGGAIWVRRFGPRAAAIGSLSFMGYFFTLFLKPSASELPAFLLVAFGAAAAQLIVRAVLLIRRPRRELAVLLRELRSASGAAVRVSGTSPEKGSNTRALKSALAQLDKVGRAITTWQHQFETDRHVGIDEQTLAGQVLDARVDIEEACYERAQRADLPQLDASDFDPRRTHTQTALSAVLDERTKPIRVRAARAAAEELLGSTGAVTLDVETYLLARSVVSHARLREIDLTRGPGEPRSLRPLPQAPSTAAFSDGIRQLEVAPAVAQKDASAAQPAALGLRGRWVPWRSWEPTSRMALQAMIAAGVAAGVGEAISASRWYWAVMTAFVIFIGATTRGSVLTRAYHRVAGTAIGIVIGIGAVTLVGHTTDLLVVVCLIAVFGMLYFGPLNYLYASAFITTLLVSLYRILGVLDGSILEIRLIETVSGAAIGVLCAYLILSTNSRVVLLEKVDAYFDAFGQLLAQVGTQWQGNRTDLMHSLQRLEGVQSDLEQAVVSSSAALIVTGPDESLTQIDAVHLMHVATRGAARLVQAQISVVSEPAQDAAMDPAVDSAIREVSATMVAAHAVLHADHSSGRLSGDQQDARRTPLGESHTHVVDYLNDLASGDVASRDAVLALGRINWALRRIAGNTGTVSQYAQAILTSTFSARWHRNRPRS